MYEEIKFPTIWILYPSGIEPIEVARLNIPFKFPALVLYVKYVWLFNKSSWIINLYLAGRSPLTLNPDMLKLFPESTR